MRGTFASLFAAVKVSAQRSTLGGRSSSRGRRISLVVVVVLNLWLHRIITQSSGMWRISSTNTTIWWFHQTFLVW
jgi:hypothetical protein